MTSGPEPFADLTGTTVLVLEDEYYLAIEVTEAIERAGGTVLGPCPDAAAALHELGRQQPDCAVVDLNLGLGPSFEIAEALQQRNVPFLFLTGYDAASIPAGFSDRERIEKPADMNRVVETTARLIRR